jgi:hypothetical protein
MADLGLMVAGGAAASVGSALLERRWRGRVRIRS